MQHLPCGAKETVCVSNGVSQTAIISVRADGDPPGRWSIY
nr:MAG TPA: hypothetical protein [Caudoviricetes sp.]